MKKIFFSIICLLTLANTAFAQELKCNVKILTPKLQTADPKIFKTLEQSITQFMNNRKWTNDIFEEDERIECSIIINITEEAGTDLFKATATVQSSRPVFNSTYNSILLNNIDKDWLIEYRQFDPVEFNENGFTTNLASLLAYYAYVVIAFDYDSFSPEGGQPYFLKAQSIINNIPSSASAPGWKPFDSKRNRYWLVENALSPRFKSYRTAYHRYHRNGLDNMFDNIESARLQVSNALNTFKRTDEDVQNSMMMQVLMLAKGDELINIYGGAPQAQKAKAVALLVKLDPSNASKYQRILKNK